MTKLGLVLSGGGSKGAYQIGVYRALRRLGKNPEIVTGTSVGAINGLLITQGDLYKAVKLWKNISFKAIYDENSFEECDNEKIASIYKEYAKNYIAEGGMDVSKMKEMFDTLYNTKKFFSSPINYGLITYNYTKNEPVIMTKETLKPNNVKDYVIASASCYPAFKPYKIKNELFIDGGYYDNLPINLAIDLGADEIVAVNLRAVGFIRKPKIDIPITMIKPRNKIVSFLVFDKAKSREALHFGYNDTMKTFGKLDGDKLTFKKGNLVKNYNKYSYKFEEKLNDIFQNMENNVLNKIVESSIFKNILEDKVSYRNFNKIVEKAGFIFGFEEDIIYNIKTYNKGILNEVAEIIPMSKNTILEKMKKKNFNKIIDHRQIVRFFYDAISNDNVESTIKFVSLFQDDFLVALYIYAIKGKRSAY